MPRPDRFRSHSGVALVSAMALVLGPTVASAQSDRTMALRRPINLASTTRNTTRIILSMTKLLSIWSELRRTAASRTLGAGRIQRVRASPAPDGYIAPSDISAQRAADARYAAEAQAWARDSA
jgi:hypothetical protein